ncbi:putative uncharacterized protein DDB_G0290521 [Phoenix dactylifera]|uniref:Proteoglycan 4-like n=1 Tax=Phoenix dactylifera TaxID=42345 RepID=A0A8B7CBV9_PHODC|nr:putative uncharacterized protein DDB_G0290521 [Phoenix dactylifera]
MANQPGRRQPFRFWHWVRPTPTSRPPPSPTGRPAARAPPGAPPPSAATPPPSRRPSPATSRSPSPTQEASPPRKEAATQEVSHAPSLSTPPLSRPESPTKKPVEPETEDSRPTVRALSPTTEQQEQSLSETAAQPPEAGNQTTQVSEPETVPVDTVRGTTPTQNLVLETEPAKEIKEEKSVTSEEESKKELPPVQEKPQIDTESKQDGEPSSQMGQELSMQISQPPQVEGKSKVEPELIEETQTSQIPQGEEKPEKIIEEMPNTELEVIKKKELPRSPESETAPEGTKNDEPKTKPGAQPAEKSTLSSDEPKDRAEIKSSMAEPDSEAPGPHADTGEPVTKPRSSVKQINVNDSKGRESTMGTRTIPWASPSHGDRASFHKEIDEGISKLVQKLKLGQSQQQGSESAVSIITLAGKNNGATMFLGQETTKKESDLHINKKAEASSGNKEIQKQMLSHTDSENPAITASINSNVQGINNSLLHESSCSEEDAGVHLALSIKPHQPAKSK